MMKTPDWVRPGVYGAFIGAVAVAIVGFSWGGWVTGGTARQQATDRSDTAVVSALTNICVDQSKRDPQVAERVTALKAASSYGRADIVMKNGWATMPGSKDPSRQVASACGDKIAAG
ncbi:hypothetical protein EDC65_4569 [Stella humosa]|uniref:Uncharacterized protein n=2 Tax=Stella humosa TaxID=94 RepID=A0A3N1KZ45_9PROT|nr:hypothetical protein EDC65_4569 [Stella humosa]